MIKKIFYILFCGTVILNFSGCKKDKNLPENQTIKYNLDNEPRTLDPQISTDVSANIVIMNLYEGLIRLDKDENVIPGVATSWDISQNKLNYTFYLRQNAVWSNKDKTPVTANDFVFGLQRALSKDTHSTKSYMLYCIKNARKVNIDGADVSILGVKSDDLYTLSIELECPNDEFIKLLADPLAMPCNKDFFEKSNGQYGLNSDKILSNGAFKIKPRYGWDHYHTLSLVNNENYIGNNKPIPAEIDFTISKNMTNIINLINTSEVDAAIVPQNQVEAIKNSKIPKISFNNTLWGLAFNTKNEIFSNLNVRKGFLAAINREYVLNKLPENCQITNDIVLDDLIVDGQNFREHSGKNLYIKQDPNAKQCFDSGIGQLSLKKLPQIAILCIDSPITKEIISNIIENINNNLGYYFNMDPVSEKDFRAKIASADYQIALAPIVSESKFAFDFLNIFRSDNNKNIFNFKNVEYDNFLSSYLFENNNKNINYLISAEKFLDDNAIFYPMYLQSKFFVHSDKISNLIFHKNNQCVDFFFATKVK